MAYGYGYKELIDVNRLSRRPQSKAVRFEMHFAAMGLSDAHCILTGTPNLSYFWIIFRRVVEFGKIQHILQIFRNEGNRKIQTFSILIYFTLCVLYLCRYR